MNDLIDSFIAITAGNFFEVDGPTVNPQYQSPQQWPFPPFPNPLDKGNKVPKFNPDNFEDAPL
jgi:hypothetical protein